MKKTPQVIAVCRDSVHAFSKHRVDAIRLLEGLGVEGDTHSGRTVQHRSRVRVDPSQPNLRQVHLIHAELFDELAASGFEIAAGDLGENITTHGIDLLALPRGTRLRIGADAVVEITGLRNPCKQIDNFRAGLTEATLERRADGTLVRKAGVMGVVIAGGDVTPGAQIEAQLPALPHRALEPV